MKRALLLVLLATSAHAQVFGGVFGGGSAGGGGSSGGGGGIQAVNSLGACASPNQGQTVYLTTANGLRVCDGATWRSVFSSRDGVLPNADVYVPGYTFIAQAPAGDYAFRANNRAKWDFGDGVSDECVSIGMRVSCNSWQFGDVRTDVIANSTTNQHVLIDPTQYLRVSPRGGTGCSSATVGGLQTNSADSNRPYWCDGTNRFRISRVLLVPVTFDFPSIPASSCATSDVTVTGAAASDTIGVNADFALPATVSVGNVRSTAANTVSLRMCNLDPANPADPASGTYNFRIER